MFCILAAAAIAFSGLTAPPEAFAPATDTVRDSLGRQPAAAAVYNGRAGQLDIVIPRIAADIPMDGTLDAPVWARAALLTGFSQYLPTDGVPAEDSTQVLVWYSPTAIYFGVRAFEAHGAVHAALANRDAIDADDNIQIVLSPFIHSRQALVFAANAFGVQEDGTITQGTFAAKTFGLNSETGPPPTDLTPDFVYESKGQLTKYGYNVVIRIPFRSVKYQSADPQNWGLNVIRKIQHSGSTDSWYPARLAAASFLDQAGTLVGLTGLERGRVLDVNPFVTQKALGAPSAAVPGDWAYGVERPQFGSNIRWGLTNNLIFNGTYRPDFAEVESDATQLVLDPRNAVQYPEKRPFFLDGLELFNTPNNLIYTRDIEAPIWATKLTGKAGDLSVAYLGAQDDEGNPVAGGGGHPLFNIVRLQQDVGKASMLGVAITDLENGGSFNRMVSADTRLTFGQIYSLALQAAGSSTRTDSVKGEGPLWEAHFIRAGRTFVLDYNITGIDPDFEAGSGFITRAGVTTVNLDHRLTLYPQHSIFRTIGGDFSYIGTWVYREFTAGGEAEDPRYHFTGLATLKGGWQVNAGIFFEHYGYDPSLYSTFYLGHIGKNDTTYTPYVGSKTIPNTDYVFQLVTPQFSKFDLTILEIAGRDENFFEWSAADISVTEMTLDWRPTAQLRAQLMYNAQWYWRHDDGSIVGKTTIPRLDIEYQLSRPIFFRLVGQYDAVYQDSLRDDSRSGLPVFYRNPNGTFTRASAVNSNQFQVQALFAYQPVPGTVAFLGYGNNLDEPFAFRFGSLRRTSDNFFIKFSYLFHL